MDKTQYKIGEFMMPKNVIFGCKAINTLAEKAVSFGKTAFLITGRRAMKKYGVTDKLRKQLLQKGIKTILFDYVENDPCLATIENGLKIGQKEKIDFVIGLGGGSALDAAKAIAGIFNETYSVRDLVINDKILTAPGLKFIACPTTSGSGTEVTRNAVLTIAEIPAKKSIRHPFFIPELAIIDPELTLSLPPDYTAACGLDALTHAVEAYTSTNSFAMTDTLALEAVSLIGQNLIKAYKNPRDISAREKMSLASTLAGLAFSNGGLGAAHALAHPLGVIYKIPHGTVNGLLISAVMRLNLNSRKDKFLNIARALSKNKTVKYPETAVELVEGLKKKLGLKLRLRDFGVKKDDFINLAEGTKYSASIKSNPVPCGKKELIKILESSY